MNVDTRKQSGALGMKDSTFQSGNKIVKNDEISF